MATAAPPQTSSLPRVASVLRLCRRTLAETAAGVEVMLGAGVVLAAAERRSVLSSANHGAFSPWFAGPLRGMLPTLTRNPAALHRDLRVTLFAMVAAWVLVVLGGGTVRRGAVIGAVLALHAIFLLSPPFALTDVFNYLGYARLDVLHHANPYAQLPLLGRGDPVYAYSNWHRLRSPYGPLFTLLLLPTAASLGLLAAVWACARRLGRSPAASVAFVGLNPVVVVYALGGKHNDLLMMGCLLAGCALILARREILGGATLAAAVAIKASAGLLVPVVALAAPRRWRAAAGVAAGGLVLAEASVLAFAGHWPDLHDQDRLVNTYSFPNLIGYATGHGGADASVRRFMTVVLVCGAAVCAATAWGTRRWATPAGSAGLLGVICVSWLMPWYVLWALPFAALSRSRVLRSATVLMTVWLVFVWSGLGPLLANEHGIHVRRTAVGQANHRFTDGLLTDRPHRHERRRPRTARASNRRPTSAQPRHTGRR
jgi:hypothetical protein